MASEEAMSPDDRASVRHSADTGDVLVRAAWSGPIVSWRELGAPLAAAKGAGRGWARVLELELVREGTREADFVARVLAEAWPTWAAGELALDLRDVDVAFASTIMGSLARELWRRYRVGGFVGAVVLAREAQCWIASLLLNDAGMAA